MLSRRNETNLSLVGKLRVGEMRQSPASSVFNFSDNLTTHNSLLSMTSLFLFCCSFILYVVSQEEVECLLYAYRGLTKSPEGRVDRVTFRDLLHDHFIMSDDFFMDRGEE